MSIATPAPAISDEPNAWAASSISGRPNFESSARGAGRPEQMDGHDRLRVRSDSLGDALRIEIERLRVDVREHRGRAHARDRLRSRVERERRTDHLCPCTDLERVEHEDQRVGAVRDPDRLSDTEIARRFLLEGADVRSEHELPALEHVVDRDLQLWEQRRVLRLDVDQRDRIARRGHVRECTEGPSLRTSSLRRPTPGSHGGDAPVGRRAMRPLRRRRRPPRSRSSGTRD